jgi:integrase
MLVERFNQYRKKSTKKSAAGMSNGAYKPLLAYVKKYEKLGNANYDTFKQFLETLNVSHNSKCFIANSLGRFLWIEKYINQEDFKRLKESYKPQIRNWSSKHISNDDLRIVFDEIQNNSRTPFVKHRNMLMVCIFCLTGLRVSQITNIKTEDVVIDDEYIHIYVNTLKRNSNDTNNTQAIKIHLDTKILNYTLRDVIHDYMQYPKQEYFFSSKYGKITDRNVQTLFRNISKKYNISITPHSFRHEQITRTTNKHGIHIAAILAGHKSVTTTMRYVNPEHIDIGDAYNNWAE